MKSIYFIKFIEIVFRRRKIMNKSLNNNKTIGIKKRKLKYIRTTKYTIEGKE